MDSRPPDHGTRTRYLWRERPCRCSRCTQANTDYIAAYRRRVRARLPEQLAFEVCGCTVIERPYATVAD